MTAHKGDGKSIWQVLLEGDAFFNRQGQVYNSLHRFVQWVDEG